jgi:ribosomal protein S21
MSSVIVKENETLDSARETVRRLVSSRRFVRESITRSQA